MVMVTDPQGAPFYLMRGFPEGESKVYRMMETGHVAWNELVTRDVDAAFAFYKDLFGWTEGEEVPIGDAGRYRMFEQTGRSIGGFMSLAEQEIPPMWVFYVAVDDIDAAHAAIVANDGKPLHDPQPIPGDMFTVAAQDPQGAMFAVVGKREE
jgi:predicted enzyme related to lactoylglutathione lyase